MEDLHFADVAVDGVTLHLAEAGPADGRLHWVQHNEPERCRDILLKFLKSADVT